MWEDNNNIDSNTTNSEVSASSEPIYSFWADKVTLNPLEQKEEDPTAHIPIKEPTMQTEQLPIVKKYHFRKVLYFIISAAIFGVIAGGTFLGFNEIYYHYNKDARPVNSNYELNLDPKSGMATLSTTTIRDNAFLQDTDLSDIIEETQPATVSIESTFASTSYFFGNPYVEENSGGGSGIIISENDTEYLIATNSHVVYNANTISVTFVDDVKKAAYIKGTDPEADLAVIAVKKSDLSEETVSQIKIAQIGNSDEVKVGQLVIAIGNALGYGQSVTIGYISAKDRVITNSTTNTELTVLQVDAAINPGNSGGALLNAKGEVIGINSAKISGIKVEGIGYAIPITKAFPIVSDLMTREVLTNEEKGYLGILMDSMSDITEEVSELYNWPIGVYIREITKNSAAEKAGIQTGDIIIAVNDNKVTTKSQLREKVTSYRHGTVVTITLMRYQGTRFEEMEIDVTLGTGVVQ